MDTWTPWTPEEKIEYVKKMILDKAKISPSGSFYVDTYTLAEGEDEYSPVYMEKSEQQLIIWRLEEEGFIQNVERDENRKNRFWFELSKEYDSHSGGLITDNAHKRFELKSAIIRYENDAPPSIIIDDKKCLLPPFKNEHYFCGVMFKYKKDKPVDSSIIYEKMTGNEFDKDKSRAVYDAMTAVNNRIKKLLDTDDKLFIWQEKTVRRVY